MIAAEWPTLTSPSTGECDNFADRAQAFRSTESCPNDKICSPALFCVRNLSSEDCHKSFLGHAGTSKHPRRLHERRRRDCYHAVASSFGVMFFDRMNETDLQAIEPQIDEFVTVFRHDQSTGERPSDDALTEQLKILERDGLGG